VASADSVSGGLKLLADAAGSCSAIVGDLADSLTADHSTERVRLGAGARA